ncbi:MAG: hypothetical protein IPO62_13020 [Saprospiraceae bacterium]|nr:hypothetical protein [Saprospiraceae bacterium]
MEFKNLTSDDNCDCIENSIEDTVNLYAIKTNKSELRLQDFSSYREKGRNFPSEKCNDICSYKGVSISLFTQETQDEVKQIYRTLFPLAPKYKPYLSVVKFYTSSGVVKHTPVEINRFHYDLFKCDTFDFTKVNLITVNELH